MEEDGYDIYSCIKSEYTDVTYSTANNLISFEEFNAKANDGEDESSEVLEEEEPISLEDNNMITGIRYYDAEITNVKSVIENATPGNAILIKDGDFGYLLNKDNQIIAIDIVDDKSIEDSEIVSTSWLDGINEELDELRGQNYSADDEESNEYDDPSDENTETELSRALKKAGYQG